jgi:hypothetical protein
MATTYTLTSASEDKILRVMKGKNRHMVNMPSEVNRVFVINRTFTITDTHVGTINNIVNLLDFPPNTILLGLEVVATDMDTNATPALVIDFQVYDGTTTTVLINDSTIGQGAGNDALDAGVAYTDVSSQYLQAKFVAAAATAAAGTIQVKALVAVGPKFSVTSW